jgi:3-isopropylmalate/(R)-2-methylmalate dehydratase small subunit
VLPVELAAPEHAALAARVVATDGASPFTVDLAAQKIHGQGGPDIAFEIASADRMRLLEGLDDIGLTLKHSGEIAAWEQRAAAAQPWLQSLRDYRR